MHYVNAGIVHEKSYTLFVNLGKLESSMSPKHLGKAVQMHLRQIKQWMLS